MLQCIKRKDTQNVSTAALWSTYTEEMTKKSFQSAARRSPQVRGCPPELHVPEIEYTIIEALDGGTKAEATAAKEDAPTESTFAGSPLSERGL